MKNVILGILSIASVSMLNAQSDIIKTSQTEKTTKINEDGVAYNTKVKVITEKKQRTQFEPSQKYQLNQDRANTPITVEKTIMIDNDIDPFYDKKIKVKYFKFNGKKYSFFIDQNSVLVTYKLNDKDITSTTAIKSKNNNFYIVKGADFNGVGYFNKHNDFVVEYYNAKTNTTEFAIFETFEFK